MKIVLQMYSKKKYDNLIILFIAMAMGSIIFIWHYYNLKCEKIEQQIHLLR